MAACSSGAEDPLRLCEDYATTAHVENDVLEHSLINANQIRIQRLGSECYVCAVFAPINDETFGLDLANFHDDGSIELVATMSMRKIDGNPIDFSIVGSCDTEFHD